MSSWHAARCGRPTVPSPLQQRSIDKAAHSQAQVDMQLLDEAASQMPSSAGASGVADEWAGIPWSLVSLVRGLVARESESARHQRVLKAAVEELRRSQQECLTTAAAAQMTVGTATLQREFGLAKAAWAAQRLQSEARVAELEVTVAKQADQLTVLQRQVSQQETTNATSVETLQNNLAHTQRDLKERGLIMAKLADRLMDEVDQSRVSMGLIEGKLKEVERRVYTWEYSTASGASGGAVSNPFSSSVGLTQRKQANFVTHDAIQPSPPGTAIYKDAAQAALIMAAEQNLHPLADVIEQHRVDKANDSAMQIRHDAQQRHQEQLQSGWEDTPGSTSPLKLASPSVSRPQTQQSRNQQLQEVPPHSVAAAPSTVMPVPVQQPDSGNIQYNRYQADYTTRNLQRDLLEIAETYQSTIRNEVDGLRGQLLAARRGHSEDMAKHTAAFDSFSKGATATQVDLKRTVGALELFLKQKIGELMERMGQVEKTCGQIDGLSIARGAQLELKYQQRNEEIVAALTAMQSTVDTHVIGRLPPGQQRKAGFEKDLMVLNINQEAIVRTQAERHATTTQDLARVKAGLEEARSTLQAQIVSVHTQMKSLFADAFAAVHNDILPAITASSTGAHGAPGPAAERTRFAVRPRTMETEARAPHSRTTKNITNFDSPAKYRTTDSPAHAQQDSVHRLTLNVNTPRSTDEEKSDPPVTFTPRGYGTSQQVRLRQTPVSSLSRGHGSTVATTHGDEITLLGAVPISPSQGTPASSPRALSARSRAVLAIEREQRPPQIEDVLRVGKRELMSRPATSHGAAASDATPSTPR